MQTQDKLSTAENEKRHLRQKELDHEQSSKEGQQGRIPNGK